MVRVVWFYISVSIVSAVCVSILVVDLCCVNSVFVAAAFCGVIPLQKERHLQTLTPLIPSVATSQSQVCILSGLLEAHCLVKGGSDAQGVV